VINHPPPASEASSSSLAPSSSLSPTAAAAAAVDSRSDRMNHHLRKSFEGIDALNSELRY